MAKVMMTSSSPPLLLLLIIFVVVVVSSDKHIATHPDRLAIERQYDDWKHGLLFGCTTISGSAVPYEDGFKTLTKILGRFSIEAFIWANKLDDSVTYQNRTNVAYYYVPSCANRLKMYVKRMENEKEAMEKDLGLLEDLRSGRRAVKRVRKKMFGFDASLNFTIARQVYRDYFNFRVYEVDGFGSLTFPESKSGYENKIEFAVVTEIHGAGDELEHLRRFMGRDYKVFERSIIYYDRGDLHLVSGDVLLTMLYTVYF